MNPREIIARVAGEYLGTRESSRNRGPEIAKFWDATNYREGDEDRAPWCSAFVSWVVQEADRRSPALRLRTPPRFAAVADWRPWAIKPENGCQVFSSADVSRAHMRPLAGDIVTFLPHLSHIGVVAEDYDWRGIVRTTEGNTNAAGSREGDGVYAKERMLAFCGTFIRLPCVGVEA